jgi:ornithine carbamoyltransferase
MPMNKKRDLLCVTDFSIDEINETFSLAKKLKKEAKQNNYKPYLKGKTLAMMFSKTSTRTRLSFEVGIYQLGGMGIFLDISKTQLSKGESIYDTAQVMGRYLDGIMIRTYSHREVEELALNSPIPVINGLTDYLHPCQALSDFFTALEYKKRLKGLKLAFIGDGNNVARSLMFLSAIMGTDFALASPKGFELDDIAVNKAKVIAEKSGAKITLTTSSNEAVKDSDIIYTDVWVSMGQEEEKEKREKAFNGYQVNQNLVSQAKKDVIIMHCLPAMRGLEITDDVMDGKHSVVFDQAENRLHLQKAILVKLMGKNSF